MSLMTFHRRVPGAEIAEKAVPRSDLSYTNLPVR